jgi:hypothetical protein
MAGQFRSSQWDPVLIIAQIIALQSVFYISLGGCVSLVDFLVGSHRSLDHLFVYQMTSLRDLHGKLLMTASLVNALLGGLSLWYIVQRTRQCWDFATTVFLIHVIVSICVNGNIASSASWWLTTVVGTVLMTVVGEFLCMRTEMKAIPLGVGSKVDL